MGKLISTEKISQTLELSKCSDGFWLWDATRGRNLSMRAKTEKEAFVETIGYYQERLQEVESALINLQAKVDSFLTQFNDEEDDA